MIAKKLLNNRHKPYMGKHCPKCGDRLILENISTIVELYSYTKLQCVRCEYSELTGRTIKFLNRNENIMNKFKEVSHNGCPF